MLKKRGQHSATPVAMDGPKRTKVEIAPTKVEIPKFTLTKHAPKVLKEPVTVMDKDLFSSVTGLNGLLTQTLSDVMQYKSMTIAQSSTIVPLMEGKDLHLKSKTGSGKTLAFLLPSIQKIIDNPRPRGIRMLVVSPTRELAMQIAKEAEILSSKFANIRVGITIGGTNMGKEEKMLASGLTILIATPGRLLDHLKTNAMLLKGVDTFVLDECDRLLDMGFMPSITDIIKKLGPKGSRQSILCSATNTPAVDKVVKTMLDSKYIFVSTVVEGEQKTHQKVPQFSIISPLEDQLVLTMNLIEKEYQDDFKAIVFLPTAQLANFYHGVMLKSKVVKKNVFVQHSRQSQSKRIAVTRDYAACTNGILFATDVVARGMDFPLVSHVFQIGVPSDVETYIHRVGRTGRAEASGVGYIILSTEESGFLRDLKREDVPVNEMPFSIESTARVAVKSAVKFFMTQEDEAEKKVYQSFLGYYKQNARSLKLKPEELVKLANFYATTVLGCKTIPKLEKRVVGKMGLKGVPGINYV